jgi:hypothetical protein
MVSGRTTRAAGMIRVKRNDDGPGRPPQTAAAVPVDGGGLSQR